MSSMELQRDVDGRAPVRVTSRSGLELELGPSGGVRRIQLGDDVVNLFVGNGLEPGPANLWLRLRRGSAVEVASLLGPRSPLRVVGPPGSGFRAAGTWQGVAVELRLVVAEAEPSWCWQVALESRAGAELEVDLVCGHDLALASYGGVRLNEHYVSQYIDLCGLEHPRCGFVVAARQNLAQGGRHPWAVMGALGRAVAYATDGLQVFGLAERLGQVPAGLAAGLPARRLQHEHAMPAVQTEVVRLAPGARWSGGFFVALRRDHPQATGPDDLAVVDATLAWAGKLPALGLAPPAGAAAIAPGSTLFASTPLLACDDLGEPELHRLFGAVWRHEERDGGLLSFFHGDAAHVVLRAKEARTLRPHGHILRTGELRTPDEAAMTSTAWMAGVFHSMVTQGHVSINRLVSTVHGWLGFFRAHGLRLFVELDGRWQQLGVPSAFEMAPARCRWIYRWARGTLEVVSSVEPGRHALGLRARALDGPAPRWLATLHLAVGGDDGNAATPVSWRVEGRDVIVPMPPASDLHARFPDGTLEVSVTEGAPVRVDGDGRLFDDRSPRGLPYLCVETESAGSLGLELGATLITRAQPPAPALVLPALEPRGDGAAAREVRRLVEILPWLLDDALVHYLSPRGLEQYSGGGWGTRDVSQGPLELLLALDGGEAARDLLVRVFAAQNADGDWPQWFQFIERERDIRAADSHGDIVFWPVLALARYVLATGDGSVLEARAPFYDAGRHDGAPAPIMEHVERALAVTVRRRIPGTALAAYGHGDWNDSLQPADPSLRDSLCSAWTVTLHYQTLVTLARALRLAGHASRAEALEADAAAVRRDFRRYLLIDGVIAGYAIFEEGHDPAPLLHPRDDRTGVHYSLLPMMHAILEDLCTPDEATAHLALMREHLWGPDGAHLFDRPFPYRGGVERLFQRAESSAFFGREIGVMYMHAHLRHAQMLAHVGDARGLLRSVALAHAVQLRDRVPQASLRQANCYYTSSDAAFADRYEAESGYGRIGAGQVALDGGWRVYSSGPGVAVSLVVTSLLGVRRDGDVVIIDPVIAPELDGLRAEVSLLGRRLQLEYHTGPRGVGPVTVSVEGKPVTFTRAHNPYRTGGAAIPVSAWTASLPATGPVRVRVELG